MHDEHVDRRVPDDVERDGPDDPARQGVQTAVETGLMPAMDEGAFTLDYFAPMGTPLKRTESLVGAVVCCSRAAARCATPQCC